MGVTRVDCDDYEQLREQIRTLAQPGVRRTFIYFIGAKSPETGRSWCPDCVKAKPNVEAAIEKVEALAKAETALIICNVQRDFWKDQSNPLRTEPDLLVKCVPTLLEYESDGRRLSADEHFANVDNIVNFII